MFRSLLLLLSHLWSGAARFAPGRSIRRDWPALRVWLIALTIWLLSSCTAGQTGLAITTGSSPTTADLAGKWKSEYAFYIVFDVENGTFSGSHDEQAADQKQGIIGDFSLDGNQLTLVENEDSESCPGVEGTFTTALTVDGKLRLTIVDDPCLYRVEGLFQGGQGGHRMLEFKPTRD